jgi:hypothetical protein
MEITNAFHETIQRAHAAAKEKLSNAIIAQKAELERAKNEVADRIFERSVNNHWNLRQSYTFLNTVEGTLKQMFKHYYELFWELHPEDDRNVYCEEHYEEPDDKSINEL